jgi:hypothetical protein
MVGQVDLAAAAAVVELAAVEVQAVAAAPDRREPMAELSPRAAVAEMVGHHGSAYEARLREAACQRRVITAASPLNATSSAARRPIPLTLKAVRQPAAQWTRIRWNIRCTDNSLLFVRS